MAKNLEVRFWAKVQKTETCWLWTATKIPNGYGHFRMNNPRRMTTAHRVSWLLSYGEIPDGMQVLHCCDNPPCVRPDHLFLGTELDNRRDAIAKNRRRGTTRKFSDDEIRQIRQLHESKKHSNRSLAELFHADSGTIFHIVKHHTYKNVV